MKLLVLLSALVVAFCEEESEQQPQQTPAWANETLFGKHQDSWASLKRDINATYYLLKSTYNNDSVWGYGFTCVSVNASLLSEENKTVTAEIHYKNENSTDMKTSQETIQAIKMYNYTSENGINYTAQKGDKNITIQDALVFTNKMCDIYYTINGEYELWVHENKTKDAPACCDFMFTYLALNKTVYNIYNESCTSSQASSSR